MDTLTSRRSFMWRNGGCGALALFMGRSMRADQEAPNVAKSKYVATVPFLREQKQSIGRITGTGLSGRLSLDLSQLSADKLVVDNNDFFIRTRMPDEIDINQRWAVRVRGLVDQPRDILIDTIRNQSRDMGTVLIECSGNSRGSGFGLMSAAKWSGVPIVELLKGTTIQKEATGVLLGGFDGHSRRSRNSTPGASWVLPLKELERTGAFLATKMNGKDLPHDHGFPVRLVIPGWYGCTCAKWFNEIRFVDDTEPATAQMREFASRTHQKGRPKLAKDYKPAQVELSAAPVRIDHWRVDGQSEYRVLGIVWGGSKVADALEIRFGRAAEYLPVDHVDLRDSHLTWALWTHTWRPGKAGRYGIRLRAAGGKVPARRLDNGYYTRSAEVPSV